MAYDSREHLKRIRSLQCVICLRWYGQFRPAVESHHLEWTRGKHSDWATVPVCTDCHRALHVDRRREFYRAHKGMSDVSLLAYTIKMLEEQE